MSNNNPSHLPRLLRSASNASTMAPPEPRLTRSSQATSSETPQHLAHSRFGFPSSTSSHFNVSNVGASRNEESSQKRSTSRSSSGLGSQISRPASALGRPASTLARPASALGRPATALGTRSNTSQQTNTRLPQSTTIPAPTNRKRRTSSVSSQRPAPPSAHLNQNSTSNFTPRSESILYSELQNQLAETLEKLDRVQEECHRLKTRAEEADSRANQSEANQREQSTSFSDQIHSLEQAHREKVEEIQNDLKDQLRRSQEQIDLLQSSNSASAEELKQATAQVSHLNSEIEQMDMDSGLGAAQVIELERLKAELEAKLEATQAELRKTVEENQNQIDQVTQHYHDIQSKLHQDLEQMTAEYQGCLQQQSLSPSPDALERLTSKVQQLEQKLATADTEYQKLKADRDRFINLIAGHEEEKRSWDCARNTLEEEIRELDSQAETIKRRKITSAKTEVGSSNAEHQLIDFTMVIDDVDCGTVSAKSEQRTTEVMNDECSLFGFISRDQDSSILGLGSFPKIDANLARNQPTTLQQDSSLTQNKSDDSSGPISDLASPEIQAKNVELENLQAELSNLKTELQSAHETITQLQASHSEDLSAAHASLETEMNAVKKDLEDQLANSKQMVDDLQSNMIAREIHENVQNDLQRLEVQVSELRVKLAASEETVCALNMCIDDLKKDSVAQLTRLSETHKGEIQSSAEQTSQWKEELENIKRLYAESSLKLKDLEAFSPERVSVLTSRLRAERDEARDAVEFMRVEQAAIEEAGQRTISELQREAQNARNETAGERNDLVITISILSRALESWKRLSYTENPEIILVEGAQDTKAVTMDVDDLLATYSTDHQSFANQTNAQAYAATLEQITLLTQQVEDLKEELVRAHLAHQEQEKQTSAELDDSRQQTILLKQQRAESDTQQALLISSLEAKLSGLQHQFHSLDGSYDSVREEKAELQRSLEESRAKLEQANVDKDASQSHADRLSSEIRSMEADLKAQEKRSADLEGQLSVALQAPDLAAQVEQLTHEIQEQKKLVEAVEEQLQASNLVREDLMASNERLEEKLQAEECDQDTKSDQKLAALKEELEQRSSELSDMLEQKSALVVELQANVCDLTAQIQEAHHTHDQIQVAADEKHRLIECQLDDLRQKVQITERENESLASKLEASSQEHQAFKEKILSELEQAQVYSSDMMDQQFKLNEALEKEREKATQSGLDKKNLQSNIDSLRSQIQSMEAAIETGQKEVADLNTQLSVAHQTLTENQAFNLPTEEGDHFTVGLKEQEARIEALEEQLEAANSLQLEHLTKVERLEEALRLEKLNQQTESVQHVAQVAQLNDEFDEDLSKLSHQLDDKSSTILQLQEEVNELNTRIEAAHQKHQQIQEELEGKLSELSQAQVVDEEDKSVELERPDAGLLEKLEVAGLENERLVKELEARSAEHQALKDEMSAEIKSTKDELSKVVESKDLISQQFEQMKEAVKTLTSELEELKLQQSAAEEARDQHEVALGELEALKEKLATVTAELELVRAQYSSGTSVAEELRIQVEEKDSMINLLKADLATVSKLHSRLSSTETADRIKDLEARVESKSAEAEDALDRLLDEMQKNKRLSNLVETLKVKLKSKTKSVIPLDERVAGSEHDEIRIVAGPSGPGAEGATGGSNVRKRKHESSGQPSRSRTDLAEGEEPNKENPGGGHPAIRRKINGAMKPVVVITSTPGERARDRMAEADGHLAILQPVSVNQPASGPPALDSTAKPSALPPKTNSNLLASIQSLRRKQQQKAAAAPRPPQIESRRSSLRLGRKDQDAS